MRSVQVGVTLKMYDYATHRPKSTAEIADQARLAERVGFDSVWVMDHMFIQRPGYRVLSHDPLISLAHVAAHTTRIRFGTLVLNHAFRHPAQLAREASALSDIGGGRFILGLGAGWHQPEFDAIGLPFDHRVGRLEEAVDPLKRLLNGERAGAAGKWLRMTDASIGVTAPPPPVWIAAEGPRMLALAARSDGWNHAYWGAEDTARFRTAVGGLRDELERIGRDASLVETSASVACVLGEWRPTAGGFREPDVAVGPPEKIADVIHSYAEAGAQHVILSLSPDPYGEIDATAVEKAAEVLEIL